MKLKNVQKRPEGVAQEKVVFPLCLLMEEQ
jgi:hypothetical protein